MLTQKCQYNTVDHGLPQGCVIMKCPWSTVNFYRCADPETANVHRIADPELLLQYREFPHCADRELSVKYR